jgi:hypothetical protein
LNNVYSLQGGTSSTMLWPTTFGSITICSMTRATDTSFVRILAGDYASPGYCDYTHGHWRGSRGRLYSNGWKTPGSRGTATHWLVMCAQNSQFNSNAPPNNIIADGKYMCIESMYISDYDNIISIS